MMIRSILFYLLMTVFGLSPVRSQEVTAPSIYSAKITVPGTVYGLPLLTLGNPNGLVLSFDDLTKDARYYRYRLQHCDRDWNPTDLAEIEYLEGINDQLINDYAFSNQTYVEYVHYEVPFPNRDLRPKISGNYTITIYDENTDEVVLVRKFMVVDKKVFASANFRRPSQVSKIRTHQEMELQVNFKDFPISNPRQEVTVTVLQNGIWARAIDNIEPRNAFGDMIEFDWRGKLVFPGGKDFRSLDMRDLGYRSFGIEKITEYRDGYVVIKDVEQSRADRNYFLEKDQNGNFVIDNRRNLSGNQHITSEYAEVDFRLDAAEGSSGTKVYVTGGFSNYSADPKFELKYNPEEGLYSGTVLMKQGRYDYFYAAGVPGTDEVDFSVFEGDSQETENFYLVLTYYRPFGGRYDQLISADILNNH